MGIRSCPSPRRDRKPAAFLDPNPPMSLELRSLLPYPNSCLGTSPHQQEGDTKMQSVCGIDVSKDRLDIMVLPEQQCFSVRNDAAGWVELVERLRGFSISAIGLEASGGYERGAMRALLAAGMPPIQAAAVRTGQWGSGQERSARRSYDRLVRRHHADTAGAASRASDRKAGGDARRAPSAQCRESRRRECFQIAGRCDAAAAFSPSHQKARSRYRNA